MRTKRFLAIVLSLALLCGLYAPAVSAAENQYSDTKGHWAESSIERWGEVGVLNGKGDGNFDPNGSMTRAEFAQMLATMMGYTARVANTFTDVPAGAWYEDAMLKLVAAGVLSGNGDGTATPNDFITREQAAVMLCRAFDLQPSRNASLTYQDSASISSWARDAMAALAERGMMNGVGNNTAAPQLNISRASVAMLADNMISEYVTESTTLTGNIDGIVLVAGGVSVNLDNATVSQPVIVAPKASGVNVNLTGSTRAENIVVEANSAKVNVGSDASASSVTTSASNTSVTVSGRVDTVDVAGSNSSVNVSGTVGTVSTEAPNTNITVSGTVGSVDIGESANSAKVTASASGKIDSVTTGASNVTVSGNGSVGSVTATGGSADVTTKGTEVKNEGANNVSASGQPVSSGSSATSNGTSSSSSSPSGSSDDGGSSDDSGGGSSSGGSSSGGGSTGGGTTGSGGGSSHTHTWNEGVVTTQPTCTEPGVKTYTCTGCGETKTEAIAALGHNYAAVYDYGETGHWHACSRCDATDEPAAHVYPAGAKCEEAAECTVCGYVKPAGVHAWDEGEITMRPTCTERGEKAYVCTICGTTTAAKLDPLGHDFAEEFTVDQEATCTAQGSKSKHCSRCEEKTEVTVIPLAEHSYGNWTKKDDKTHTKTCSVCGDVVSEAHEWNDGVAGEDGATTYVCTVCGADKTDEAPDYSPKTWDELVTALTTAEGGQIIKLSESFNAEPTEDRISIAKGNENNPIILDLNGKELNISKTGGRFDCNVSGALKIQGSGTLELNNSSFYIVPGSYLFLEGGTITGTGPSAPIIIMGGTFGMSGGTVNGKSCTAVDIGNGPAGTAADGTFIMTGGTINGSGGNFSAVELREGNPTFTMREDGIININCEDHEAITVHCGTFTMDGGNVTTSSTKDDYIYTVTVICNEGVEVSLNDGTITNNCGAQGSALRLEGSADDKTRTRDGAILRSKGKVVIPDGNGGSILPEGYTLTIKPDEDGYYYLRQSASNEMGFSISSGTLTISGTGDMDDAPWDQYKDDITAVVISEGITTIGDYAFSGFEKMASVDIPGSITRIGSEAFSYCYALSSVYIPSGVTGIGSNAFMNCTNLETVYYGGSKDDWDGILIDEPNRELKDDVHIEYGYTGPLAP